MIDLFLGQCDAVPLQRQSVAKLIIEMQTYAILCVTSMQPHGLIQHWSIDFLQVLQIFISFA